MLRQALTNVLQNAQDSLAEARVKDPQIALELQINDGLVALHITDNGPGFPEIDKAQLLEPYVTKRDKGTGLGLAIVSKVVRDHSGELHLVDVPHGGARVTIELPLHKDAETAS